MRTVPKRACHRVSRTSVSAPAIAPQIELLRAILPERVPLMAYGNIGHPDHDGDVWVDSDAIAPERYADYAEAWAAAGATMIGGCCGTTPETIRAVAHRLGGAP